MLRKVSQMNQSKGKEKLGFNHELLKKNQVKPHWFYAHCHAIFTKIKKYLSAMVVD